MPIYVNESTDATTGDRYVETLNTDSQSYMLTINGSVWVARSMTQDEVAREAAAEGERTAQGVTYDLHVKARAALAASATALTANATYIARTTTTTAQDKAQLKALSNQVNALIRQVNALTRLALAADLLRDTTGT